MPVVESNQSVDELLSRLGPRIAKEVKDHAGDPPRGFVELSEFDAGVAKVTRLELYAKEGVLGFRGIGVMETPLYGKDGRPVKGEEIAILANLPEGNSENGVTQTLDALRAVVGQTKLDALIRSYESAGGAVLKKVVESVHAHVQNNAVYVHCSNKYAPNTSGRIDGKTGQPFAGKCWPRWIREVVNYSPLATPPGYSGPVILPVTPPSVHNGHAKSPETFSLTSADLEPDYDVLADHAEAGDEGARNKLYAAAGHLGYTEKDCEESGGWEEIAGWVKSGVRKGNVTTTAVFDTQTPTVNLVVKYLPQKSTSKDPSKRVATAIDCMVSGIGANKTMTLMTIDGKKTFSNVSWSDPYVTYPSASLSPKPF